VSRGIAGIKDHQAHEHHHVRQPVQGRIQEATEPGHSAGKSGHLPVEHVEQVRHHQGDSSRKKTAHAKEQAATNIQRDSNHCKDVWIDVTISEPAY
jgi:hypothetical protein